MVDNPNNEVYEELKYIYKWIDNIPLSRSKKNMTRDFCDGVLLAEVIKYYLPKLVDLHNYPSASSTNQKCYNWTTLNNKVLKKINVQMSNQEINDIISGKSLSIERILQRVYTALERATGLNFKGQEDSRASNETNQAHKQELLKILEDKDQNVQLLRQIVPDFEQKLVASNNTIQSLEQKIEELTQLAYSRGINPNA